MTRPRLPNYKDPLVWQKVITLEKQICHVTGVFSGDEKRGLLSQIRRAAVSIPSNIAEGQARIPQGEFVQFLSHAEGLAELETQLIIAAELGYGTLAQAREAFDLISELRKMLNGLRRKLLSC